MKVSIKPLRPDIPLPQHHTVGSVAFDLAPCDDAIIGPGEIKWLPTGLVICTPPGYMLMIAPRSSTAMKWGLQNPSSVGVIDQDFCGAKDEIKLCVRNFTDKPVTITKGTRLSQGIFVKIDKAEWEELEKLDAPSRGGWGSTGH